MTNTALVILATIVMIATRVKDAAAIAETIVRRLLGSPSGAWLPSLMYNPQTTGIINRQEMMSSHIAAA
jgi:hypothetical protein